MKYNLKQIEKSHHEVLVQLHRVVVGQAKVDNFNYRKEGKKNSAGLYKFHGFRNNA